MSYTILKSETVSIDIPARTDVTVITEVQFDFLDAPTVIQHFNPKEGDVEIGIANREITERNKLNL